MAELATIPEGQELVSTELNSQILAVLSNNAQGFQKAFVMAQAISTLKEKLTPEYMQPIMQLQGTTLGFKTDKDLVKNNNTGKYEKGPGYSMEIVRDCLIEMVLIGLQPTGNEFNIIAGNPYIAKNGATSLIKQQPGLTNVVITYPSCTQSPDKRTATVKTNIKWEYNNESREQNVDFPIKSDSYTTFDALIGKAERKAKVWLYNQINGTNFTDGDVYEIPHEEIKPTPKPNADADNKRRERITNWIINSYSVEKLKECYPGITSADGDLLADYTKKWIELSKTLKQLKECEPGISDDDTDLLDLYDTKKRELTKNQ